MMMMMMVAYVRVVCWYVSCVIVSITRNAVDSLCLEVSCRLPSSIIYHLMHLSRVYNNNNNNNN